MNDGFRKDKTLIFLANQHSNGILDFDTISYSDAGQYVCRGQNQRAFSEEILTLEILGTSLIQPISLVDFFPTRIGTVPSIAILPKTIDNYLEIPLYSTQPIECVNMDPSVPVDITWRRTDTVRLLLFS